ncbi:hypothetical protein DITRI_Ditri07aG0111100 [Diplodiscus trichospermus]
MHGDSGEINAIHDITPYSLEIAELLENVPESKCLCELSSHKTRHLRNPYNENLSVKVVENQMLYWYLREGWLWYKLYGIYSKILSFWRVSAVGASRLIHCFFWVHQRYCQVMFKEAFTRLGLLNPPPEEDYYSANHSSGIVVLMDSRSRSLVPVPVEVLTATIKKNLPILEYGHFIKRFGDNEQAENHNTVCTVCLESMEKSDEIRELCKCYHVFHKECLDRWVNEGQVTCPLCRCTLYPEPVDWTGRATDSWRA